MESLALPGVLLSIQSGSKISGFQPSQQQPQAQGRKRSDGGFGHGDKLPANFSARINRIGDVEVEIAVGQVAELRGRKAAGDFEGTADLARRVQREREQEKP